MTCCIDQCYYRSSSNTNLSTVKQMKHRPSIESLEEASSFDRNKVICLIGMHFPELARASIQVVKNDFLETLYLLKKAEMQSKYDEVQEHLLIHVTGAANVESIVRENFDWRRVTRGKFGIGTSFSDDAQYANRYANFNIGEERAFIISRVLVSRGIQGNKSVIVPPHGIDTTLGNNKKVIVKFCDNEALPTYVVYYRCDNIHIQHFAKLTNKPGQLDSKHHSVSRQFDSNKENMEIKERISSEVYTRSFNATAAKSVRNELERSDVTDEYYTEDSDMSCDYYETESNCTSEGEESYYSQNSDECLEYVSDDQDYFDSNEENSEDDPDDQYYSDGSAENLEIGPDDQDYCGSGENSEDGQDNQDNIVGYEENIEYDPDDQNYSGSSEGYVEDDQDYSNCSEENSEDDPDGRYYSDGSAENLEDDLEDEDYSGGSEEYLEDDQDGQDYSGGSEEYLEDDQDGQDYSCGSEEYLEDDQDGQDYSGGSEEYLEDDQDGQNFSGGSEEYLEDDQDGQYNSSGSEEHLQDDYNYSDGCEQ